MVEILIIRRCIFLLSTDVLVADLKLAIVIDLNAHHYLERNIR